MGKISHDRHIHFNYDENFMILWNMQSDTFKNKCEELGEPYGYSPQNVFYSFLIMFCTLYYSGDSFNPWQ